MRVRPLLILTALASSILGAVVVYLVLTVPNDLKAGALLRQARASIKAGHNDKARDTLARIVQQFPRTDAAAAATVAIVQLQTSEQLQLEGRLAALERALAKQIASSDQLQRILAAGQPTPPPAPPPVVAAPPPVAVRPPAKAAPPRHRHHSRRRT